MPPFIEAASVAPAHAAPQGAPELLAKAGYLGMRGSPSEDGESVTHRVHRHDPRTGRIEARVDVLRRVAPGYRPIDQFDGIRFAVHCGNVLWIVRGSDVAPPNRVYWITARAHGEITSAELNSTFDARAIRCDRRGAAYLEGSAEVDGEDRTLFLRVAPGRSPELLPRGSTVIGGYAVTRDGIAFVSGPRGRTTLLNRDGTKESLRPRNRRAKNAYDFAVASDGRHLFVEEGIGTGSTWVRRFSERGRGFFVGDGYAHDTACGSLILHRTLSPSSFEISFLRRRRVSRPIRTDSGAIVLDQRRGLVAIGRRIYWACGSRTGRVRTVLRGGRGSTLIGAVSD